MLRRELAKQLSLEAQGREALGLLHRCRRPRAPQMSPLPGEACLAAEGSHSGWCSPLLVLHTEYTHQEADGKHSPQCEINTF